MAQKNKRKIKVLVLMGGPSVEHEVSLNTGKQVLANLDRKKYVACPLVVTQKGKWLLPSGGKHKLLRPRGRSRSALQEAQALKKLRQESPDVAFIAMHGTYGEDGTIQGLLESIGLSYTGSGVLASALGMDKPRASVIFQTAGLLIPPFEVVTRKEAKKNILVGIIKKLGWPLVVKPSNHGSSVGVNIVKEEKGVRRAMAEAFKYSTRVILQKFISGRELTCGVLEDEKGKLLPLPPTEIIPLAGDFYDYTSKYAAGGSKHIVPPRNLAASMIRKIQEAACLAHNVIGCSGMSRSDFILGQDGEIYILEINTIPGMTKTSLLPEAAKAVGIFFPQLLDILIRNALGNKKA